MKRAMLLSVWAAVCFQVASACEVPSQDFTEKINSFGLDVYKELAKTKGNVFFSPISISLALGMTSMGAKEGTLREIMAAMKMSPQEFDDMQSGFKKSRECLYSEKGTFTLALTNRLYVDQSYNHEILEDFKSNTRDYYGSVIEGVDFKNQAEDARKTINDWVSRVTKDKITDLLSSDNIDSTTKLALVNAIYFKGEWEEQFDKESTTDEDFHVTKDKVIKVPTMKGRMEGRHVYSDELKSDVLELPYKGGRLSMIVILPKSESSIEELESSLSGSSFSFDLKEEKFDIWLPKFQMEISYHLKEKMRSLGVSSMFISSEADLSNIDGSKDLHVSAMVHKAFIEVNEEGAEAAASSAGTIVFTINISPPHYKVDRPFVFYIQDKQSKAVLFLGKYLGPSSEL